MPDAQQDLKSELSKLKGLNTVIMECYSRLSPLEKPVVAEQQPNIYTQQSAFGWPVSLPGTLYRRTLTKVSLDRNQWFFEYDSASGNGCFTLPPVEKHLSSIRNIFNDPLPKTVYTDLSESIDKLGYLNPDKALELIPSWKTALEGVHVDYGKMEQKITEAG